MTRLEALSKMMFYPLARANAVVLGTYFAAANPAEVEHWCAVDPCAGEGEAMLTLADTMGISRERVYLNELDVARMTKCQALVPEGNVTGADALVTLEASKHLADVLFCNPPFAPKIKLLGSDDDTAERPQEQGSNRQEIEFFRRMVEELQLIRPGGGVIYVLPHRVFKSVAVRNHLVRCLDQVTVWRVPNTKYNEIVIMGVVQASWRAIPVQKRELAVLTAAYPPDQPIEALPELIAQADAPYQLTPHPKRPERVVWRDRATLTSQVAAVDVAEGTNNAWTSARYQERHNSIGKTRHQPAFPPTAFMMLWYLICGYLDGADIEIGGVRHRIKGTTQAVTREKLIEKETATSLTTSIVKTTELRPLITAVGDDETVRAWIGNEGMVKLMDDAAIADAILAALDETNPALYAFDPEPHVVEALGRITRVSGRTLPGFIHAGLTDVQQHLAAACFRRLITHDPAQNGAPDHIILMGGTGTGKGSMLPAVADLLRQFAATNPQID